MFPLATNNGFKSGENWNGNKRGRPKAGKSIAEYARRKTRNGRELVDYYYKLFKNSHAEHTIRLAAAEKLEYRAFGKPPATLELGEGNKIALALILHRPDGTQEQLSASNPMLDVTPTTQQPPDVVSGAKLSVVLPDPPK